MQAKHVPRLRQEIQLNQINSLLQLQILNPGCKGLKLHHVTHNIA